MCSAKVLGADVIGFIWTGLFGKSSGGQKDDRRRATLAIFHARNSRENSRFGIKI
jgi:hypothetical protein